MNKLIRSFRLLADASYFPQSRKIRINLGFVFLFAELENTFAWLSTLILSKDGRTSLNDVDALNVPSSVKEEVRHIYDGFNTGRLEWSYRTGFSSPIYDAIMRFVLTHEMGHLVYFAVSPELKERWHKTAWLIMKMPSVATRESIRLIR